MFQLFCTVTALHTYAEVPPHLHLMQDYSLPRQRACDSAFSATCPTGWLTKIIIIIVVNKN